MFAIRSTRIGMVFCALALLAGCRDPGTRRAYQPRRMPPGLGGTIGEYADLVGANPLLVRGYGVVVGLGHGGSSEVPPALRKKLIQQMLKAKVGSRLAGTAGLTPARLLDDKDTAVVVVAGWIPPGAPTGTKFDVIVEALPQTQTLSLVGGTLLGTEMHVALNTAAGITGKVKAWALTHGDIFVNPFIAQKKGVAPAKLRVGRILNGGVVTSERPMRLELRRPDYRLSLLIQRRINQRFGRGRKVANAKSPAVVELSIPRDRRQDYEHFLAVILHTYVAGGSAEEERHVRELAEKVLLPDARCPDISLVWEAAGRQVLPAIQPLYSSRHPAAAFFATRAGLRLGDGLAVQPMIHVAEQARSPFQVPAIEELGRARQFVQCLPALKRLLGSRSDVVRVAAYEALLSHGSATAVRRTRVHDEFVLDVVDSDRDYTVYATCAGRPKVVLFGRNIIVRRPVFYCPPDEMVTINAEKEDGKVMVERKIPRTGKRSDPFYVPPRVEDLVATLGSLPERTRTGAIKGLGLTYSQVVGVLHDLCKSDHVPAKFVLQRPPQLQRIYMLTPSVGRPDLPEEDTP